MPLIKPFQSVQHVALIVLLYFSGERILRLFDNDNAPVTIALQYLHIVMPAYLGLGVGVVLGNAMAGAGATRTTMWTDFVVILGVQFPLCMVAANLGVSLRGLFMCVAVTHFLSAAAYVVVYMRTRWHSRSGASKTLPRTRRGT